jgi:hypothetical protein
MLPSFSSILNLGSFSSVPLNIPLNYNLNMQFSTKCKLSSLNIFGPFSDLKRLRQFKGDKQIKLMARAFGKLTDMLGKFSLPSALPVSAPIFPTLPGTTIVRQFLECLEKFKQCGNVWLFDDEVTQMLELFKWSELTSTYYLAIAKKSSEV